MKKWWQIYIEHEKSFFVGKDNRSGLIRHPRYDWRSVDKLIEESNLTKEEVESIILKYAKIGLIIQNPKNSDQWGYWENVAPDLDKQLNLSISENDKNNRINKALGIKK